MPCFHTYRPGDALAELPAWLGDASGKRAGMWYVFAMIVTQLVLAVISGINAASSTPGR